MTSKDRLDRINILIGMNSYRDKLLTLNHEQRLKAHIKYYKEILQKLKELVEMCEKTA